MDPYRVFISSVLNRAREDLKQERDAARAAVEHFRPITIAWAFEEEPASTKRLEDSYLDEVKSCDLLVLIIGNTLTAPIKTEYDTALDFGKQVLVFCKHVQPREPDTEQFMSSLDLKYQLFMNAVELRERVRNALGLEILRLLRGESETQTTRGDYIAHLRRLARNVSTVRVGPLTPRCKYDEFTIRSVEDTVVVLKKNSSGEEVTIPRQRVAEVLHADALQPVTVRLDGRLQWLTLLNRWKFFAEIPDDSNGFHIGVPRETSISDPRVAALSEDFAKRGLKLSWSRQDNLAERLAAGTHEVFYDDDGFHLRHSGPDVNSILVVSNAH